MANLLSNTTVGGSAVITTSNIGSYALTSIPSNVITTSGGQTIGGTTYFSGGESLNVYGIRGRFGNEYMHLYNKVGIGHPSGWGQGEGNTPGYGLSVYGGSNFAYGNNAESTFNGIVYSTASFRAPIFYDSENTTYYVDPASNSYLYGLQLSGNTYFRPSTWIQVDGNYGIYWPNHYGLHIYPNQSSYGPLQINGSKGGWAGIYFNDSGVTLMMNSNESGNYRNGYGWQYRWYNGYLYVYTNAQGGGSENTVITSGNFNSYNIPTKQYVWSR